jgi:O-antigen/teichoic acid export membrane protein
MAFDQPKAAPADPLTPISSPAAPDAVPDAAPDAQASGNPSLKQKVYAGISWTVVSSVLSQALSLLRSIVLARLLTQEDFGVAGMALTAFNALCVLTNIGTLGSGMTAHFEDEAAQRKYLNTLWTIELVRSVVIGVLMVALARPTAGFYGDSRLVPVLLVMACIPLTISAHNIGVMLYTRDVQFSRNLFVEMVQAITGVAVTIGVAWVVRSYWALVWGQLASAVIGTILSYFAHPFRPRLEIDRPSLRTALNFGKHAFLISLCAFVITTADNILVGRLLGPAVLGAYVIAYSASSLLSNVVAQVFGVVFFPLFAQVKRDRPEQLKATATRAFDSGSLFLSLMTAPMVVLAPEIITILYGTKWLVAVEPLRILAVVGFMRGLLGLLNSMLLGVNRPDIESGSRLAETVVFLAVLYPLVKNFGMAGAAGAGLVTFAFSLLMRFVLARRAVPEVVAALPASLLVSALAVSSSVFVTAWLLKMGNVASLAPRFFIGLLLCLGVSVVVFALCRPQCLAEASSLLRLVKRRIGAKDAVG